MVLAISRRGGLLALGVAAAGLAAYLYYRETQGSSALGRWLGLDSGQPRGRSAPPGWRPPPDPGADPDYQGPTPADPWREGEFAQKADRVVLRRQRSPQEEVGPTFDAMRKAVGAAPGRIAYLSSSSPSQEWQELLGERLMPLPAAEIDSAESNELVAFRLKGRGADFVLVDTREPQPMPWLQPATGLRDRLRDALPLTHFHPVVRGMTHTLYRIGSPIYLSQPQAKKIIAYIRARLAGKRTEWPSGVEPSTLGADGEKHRVAISLRSWAQGGDRQKLGWRTSAAPSLRRAFDLAIERVQKRWTKMRQGTELPEALADALDDVELEIDVFRDICEITDRVQTRLLWNLELGYEGAFLVVDGTMHMRLPSEALQTNVETESDFIERLERNAKVAKGAWRNEQHGFGRFSTLNFAEATPGGRVQAMYRGNPLVRVSEITKERLKRSLVLGARWLWHNQLPDGQFRYRLKPLKPAGDRWLAGNNVVRHALNPYTLMLVQKIAPDQRLIDGARRGLQYTFSNLRRTGNRCVVWHTDVPAKVPNAKMGAVAVTILSLIAMADSMDIKEYRDELSCLGHQLLYMQDRNGHFRQYDVPRDHSYFGTENTIFPGEILLALAKLHSFTGQERYRDAFDRGMAWYQEWWNYRVDSRTEDGVYTEKDRADLVGFVPWALMAMDTMHRKHPDEKYARFGLMLQDWIDEAFFFDLGTSPYPDYLGAYFKRNDELPAINSAGYSEGAAAAFAIAKRVGRDVERRRRTLVLGARFALQLQYTWQGNMSWIPDPSEALGGYRYHLTATRVRNDYIYHAMSALAQAYFNLQASDYPAETPIALPDALREAQ